MRVARLENFPRDVRHREKSFALSCDFLDNARARPSTVRDHFLESVILLTRGERRGAKLRPL
jgi:hypothetical protein